MKPAPISVTAFAILLPFAGWCHADAINDALEAPGLVFMASNASGPAPAAVISPSYDGAGAVSIGAPGEPQLRATVNGPATLYYRARVDFPFNHHIGTLGQSGLVLDGDPPGPWMDLTFGAAEVVPDYYEWINQTSPWVLLKADIPAGQHTVTWWGRTYGGGMPPDMGFWIDRVVLSNNVTVPIFTETILPPAVIGRAYSAALPFLGSGVTVSAPSIPPGFTLSPEGVLGGTAAGPLVQNFNITATVTNAHGSDTAIFTLPVQEPVEPLIDDAHRVWRIGGNSEYLWSAGDVLQGLDRLDCLATKYYAPGGTIAWISTVAAGPDTLRFAYSTSSQLEVLVDGVVVWTAPYSPVPAVVAVPVPAGAHEIRLQHRSHSSFSFSSLDMVSFDSDARPMLYETAGVQYGQAGEAMSIPLPATSPGSLSVTGLPAGLAYSAGEQRIAGTPSAAGEYPVRVTATNAQGSSERMLLLSIVPSIAGVLDSPGLAWRRIIGPDSPHVFSIAPNGAGGSSLTCSGGQARVQTTLTGPDQVVFAVTSFSDSGGLRVLVDGHEVTRMTGIYDWLEEGVAIPAGDHTLTFVCDNGSLQVDNVRRLSTRGVQPLLYGSRRLLLPRGAADVQIPGAGAGTFTLTGGSLPPGAALNAATGRITGTLAAGPRHEATITLANGTGSHTRTFTVFVMDSLEAALAPGAGLPFLISGGKWDAVPLSVLQTVDLPVSIRNPSRDGLAMGSIGYASPMSYSLLISGPDTLSFDWFGVLPASVRFQLDAGESKEFGWHYPLATWHTETVSIPAGTHLARWEFDSSTGGTSFLLDRVQLASGGRPRLAGPHRRYYTIGQPVNENLNLGSGTVAVAGVGLPAGLALSASGQLTGTPVIEMSAEVTLTLTAPGGVDMARFEFVIVPPLAETVGQPGRVFSTGGTGSGTTGCFSQRSYSQAGASLLTPPLFTAADTAWLETVITGPAQLTWWETLPSYGYGKRQVLDKGVPATPLPLRIAAGWREYTLELPGGSHTIRWQAAGLDETGPVFEAGLDTLTITPYGAPVFTGTAALRYQAGEEIGQVFTFSPTLINVTAADLPPWLVWNEALLKLTGTAPLTPGTFSFTLHSNNSAGATQTAITVEVTPTFKQALNLPQLHWDVSGSSAAPWFVQSAVARDGLALQSGAIPHGEKSTLRTSITGPGVFTFWWKCSAATGDEFDFRVDGSTIAELTGEADWQLYTHHLPAGVHEVHFRYEKDAATTAGADAVWLDQVAFTPAAFASWIALRRSTLAAPANDPDGDGLTNLMEYALQTDPGAANHAALPLPVVEGGIFTWNIQKPSGAPGLTWDIEVSTSLAASSWTGAGAAIIENTATCLRLRLPMNGGRQFARVKVTAE